MKPVGGSQNVDEKTVYSNVQDKSEKRKAKFEPGDFVGTADNKKVGSKAGTTNWLCKF